MRRTHGMSLATTLGLAAILSVGWTGTAVWAALAGAQAPEHQHQEAAPPGDAQHQGMMQRQQQMMADMKTADAELQALVQRMMASSGDDKIQVMEALLVRLVAQRSAMHQRMMEMHQAMMSQQMMPQGRGGMGPPR